MDRIRMVMALASGGARHTLFAAGLLVMIAERLFDARLAADRRETPCWLPVGRPCRAARDV